MPDWTQHLRAQLAALRFDAARESEIIDELSQHLDQHYEEFLAEGVTEAEAQRRVIKELSEPGGFAEHMQSLRQAKVPVPLTPSVAEGNWLHGSWQDLRLGLRSLRKTPWFTASAVLILALGIGVNTAVFSVVNALLFRPVQFPHSDRLVNLYQNVGERADPAGVSFPAYLDIAATNTVYSGVTAVLADDAQYQGSEDLQTVLVEYATSSYLDVLGYGLSAGRWFTETEDRTGPEAAAVIGYRTWETKFESNYGIIGKTIRLNGAPVTVIGIGLRALTSAMHPTLVTDFWLSMSAMASVEAGSNRSAVLNRRGDLAFDVRARLKDGISITQARAAMDVLSRRLANDHADTDPGKGIAVFATDDVVIHPGEPDTLLMFSSTLILAIVALVLAIAWSNLATLLLVRGTGRAREVSVRLAIGATRWQLIRLFLAESVLLSLAGAAAGFILSTWTIRYLATLIPISFEMRLDYGVLAFTVGLALVTGIVFGLAPALRSTRIDLLSALRTETGSSLSLNRGWFTLKNMLLASQVAGTFLLLMGTAFLIRAVMSLESQEPGFAVQGVALLNTSARYAGYGQAEGQRIYQELARRIARIPGVQSVFASSGPPVGSSVGREIEVEGTLGTGANSLRVESTWGSPGYFETLEIPLISGRRFQDYDLPGRPLVAIVNETMALRVFGSPNAVGRRFRYGGIEQSQEAKIGVEIVGVVRDTSPLEFATGPQALFYLPAAQGGVETSTVGARTSLDAAALLQAMQREVRSLDPSLPILQARTMRQNLDNRLRIWKAGIAILGGLGGVALALSSVGLYAVVRFAVSKRSIELGIRIALGAQNRQVVWLVMQDVTILIGVSLAIGSTVSLAAITLIKSFVASPSSLPPDIPGTDLATLLLVVLLMAATAGAAAYFPARQAAKTDPWVSMRHR